MRPLVPKVRLGDVLHGTRHLRHYLQTISVLAQLRALAVYSQRTLTEDGWSGLPTLYTPNRQDEFVTAVNACGRFGVWSRNSNVVLLFVNPKELKERSTVVSLSEPIEVSLNEPVEIQADKGEVRMSPALFSKWFVRTPKRDLDAGAWPRYAMGLRLCFQYNLVAWGRPSNQPTLRYRLVPGWESPLGIGKANSSWNPHQLNEQYSYVRRSAVRGYVRDKAFQDKLFGEMETGFGPLLTDLPRVKEEISQLYRICLDNGTLGRVRSNKGKPQEESNPGNVLSGLVSDLLNELPED